MNPATIPADLLNPVLSICVPTFNRARYLDCLLQDLTDHIGELGFSYELLIGDNASEDNTAEVVGKYGDRLNTRYFWRPENLGGYHNLSQLFTAARGLYVVYLADDDLLIVEALSRHIAYLLDHPEVGAVFAPWFIYDRATGQDVDQFYQIEQETLVSAKGHGALFDLLVNGHVFPEIYVAKTSLVREVAIGYSQIAFFFFVQIAAMVDRAAVAFRPEPFYRSVIRYFEDDSRTQYGIEEVKVGWDRYRGGLEYILSRVAHLLDAENLAWCHRAIDHFVRIRMQVALRLRTLDGKDWVDNYYIANRLRCVGDDSLLPAPYETYRVNAALEYLLGLQPFYPEPSTIVYYLDDPPDALMQAHNFASAGLVGRADRTLPLLVNTILLTSRETAVSEGAVFAISEAELLAKFP
ncbi:MAG: glycosyltransferase family 2 protein [Candidatus Nanopelagicales bacterium]